MRILSLGFGLPDSQVDNYDWASALSFYDYDAIVVDPAEAVSKLVEDLTKAGAGYITYNEEPITEGPSTALAVGLADLLRSRREEVERLLAHGGIVVVFAYPDVPHTHVFGFNGCHRYYWLPAPTGADYGPNFIKRAAGTQVKPVDYEHPFADFLEQQRTNVMYRATFAEGAEGIPGARVIGRSNGGAPIAIDFEVGGGRVIFLPALPQRLSTSERQAIAGSIVAAIRNLLITSVEDDPPEWLDAYLLPGLEESRKQYESGDSKLEQLEAEVTVARNAYRGLDRYRRLLWQEGKYGFDLPVRDALGLLGFNPSGAVDEPGAFYFSGELVFVETEGGIGPVGMEPHYRLRERLESSIAHESRRPHGLIVINGHRNLPPDERPQQHEDSLRVAAESMRYAVVDAVQLFNAVRDKMDGKDVSAFAKRLLQTEGVVVTGVSEASAAAAE
ncbi:MAG: hypothetical protein GEU75_12570 [Dehalococcoidia bacterium]|nr:hypothetical protein [Dehalococcoidia bacterium]